MSTSPVRDPRSSEQLRQEACHEAGHYIAARLLRRWFPGRWKAKIACISLQREESAIGEPIGGYVRFSPYARNDAFPTVVQLLGGIAAESYWQSLYGEHRILEGHPVLSTPLQEALLNQAAVLETFGGKLDMKMLRQYIGTGDWRPHCRIALELIHEHWQPLLRVANALVVRRMLSHAEAQAAFTGTSTLGDVCLTLYLCERILRASAQGDPIDQAEAASITGQCLIALGLFSEGRKHLRLSVLRFEKSCSNHEPPMINVARQHLAQAQLRIQSLAGAALERARELSRGLLNSDEQQRLEAVIRRNRGELG